ncbi:unnamed protein product, partial [Mesorhabditis spiculigera]
MCHITGPTHGWRKTCMPRDYLTSSIGMIASGNECETNTTQTITPGNYCFFATPNLHTCYGATGSTVACQGNTLHRAFNNWAAVSSAKFEEVSPHEEADIEIGFEKGRHADSFPFDGTDGIVAHAFYPRDGRLHFDADEKWTLNSDDGVNLYQTAVHEIGHLLGLEHSTDPRAAMFAAKRPYDPDFGLADDDVRAIRTLFPVNTNNNIAAKHSRIVVPPRPISTYEINSELEHMRFVKYPRIPTTTPSRINYEYEFQTTTRKPEWPIKTRKQELPFNFDPILWPGYFEAKR